MRCRISVRCLRPRPVLIERRGEGESDTRVSLPQRGPASAASGVVPVRQTAGPPPSPGGHNYRPGFLNITSNSATPNAWRTANARYKPHFIVSREHVPKPFSSSAFSFAVSRQPAYRYLYFIARAYQNAAPAFHKIAERIALLGREFRLGPFDHRKIFTERFIVSLPGEASSPSFTRPIRYSRISRSASSPVVKVITATSSPTSAPIVTG